MHALEMGRATAYYPIMDDTTPRPPAGWLESLERSEAELAAGQTVPMETVMRKLRESAARLEKKRKPPRSRAANRRR